MSLPCITAGGFKPAAPNIVGAKSTFSVNSSFVVPCKLVGMRGSQMTSGTRMDSSLRYTVVFFVSRSTQRIE